MKNEMCDNVEKIASNFFDWLIDMEYCNPEDKEEDIENMIKDFRVMQREVPRMFNLLRDICDR